VHNGIVATGGGQLIGFHRGQLIAFDRNGGARTVEWLIGGRYSKLALRR
jgi:hypothetical protein